MSFNSKSAFPLSFLSTSIWPEQSSSPVSWLLSYYKINIIKVEYKIIYDKGGTMDVELLIKTLKSSNLYAECRCGGEFKLSDALLFDGAKPFPPKAKEIQKELKEGIKEREDALKKRRKLATKKAQITTKAVNVGKNLEKVLPTMKNFKWELPDCRFLSDPIDILIFNGLTKNKINSISFVEVKSGGARLNAHQKAVKDAIEDKKVSFKVFK